MKHFIPTSDGDEDDAFSGWRYYLFWQAGELKKIKRRYNKRERKFLKRETQRLLNEALKLRKENK